MLSAAAAVATAGNATSAVPSSGHRCRAYTPPRRLGSSSGSSGKSSSASCSRRAPPRTVASRGMDRKVPQPRERHDFRSSSAHSSSDEETRISGFYGLMSLSNCSSSQQSSMSSVTNATSLQEAVKQTKDVAHIAIMACNAELERENAAFASTMNTFHNNIQVAPVTRTTVAIAPPAPPSAAPKSYSYNMNDKRAASSSLNSSFHTLPTLRSRANSYNSISTTGTSSKNMVEISPGVSLPLRGAEETELAIAAGFYVQCECLACSSTNNNNSANLHCILDCSYFLCPDCRSVAPNPLQADGDGDGSAANEGQGGLGLGFRLSQQNNSNCQQSYC